MKLFFSYSGEEDDLAEQFAEALERHGHECWYSGRGLVAGVPWATSVASAIRQANAVILLYTERSAASAEVPKELAMVQHPIEWPSTDFVPPALLIARLDDVPTPDPIAYALAGLQRIDFVRQPFDDAFTELLDALDAYEASPASAKTALRPEQRPRRLIAPDRGNTVDLRRVEEEASVPDGAVLVSVGGLAEVVRPIGSAVTVTPLGSAPADRCGVGFPITHLVASTDGSTLLAIGERTARVLRVNPDGSVRVRTEALAWPAGSRALAARREPSRLFVIVDHIDGARVLQLRLTKPTRVGAADLLPPGAQEGCFVDDAPTLLLNDGSIIGSDTDELVGLEADHIDAAASGGRSTVAALVRSRSGGIDLFVRSCAGGTAQVARLGLEGAPASVLVERVAGALGQPTMVAVRYSDDRCERWELDT